MLWLFSVSTWALLVFVALFVALIINDRKANKNSDKGCAKIAPGPRQWPIIGSIPYMATQTKGPQVAFSNLAREFGDVVTLKLGSLDTVVVSGLDNFRKVLVTQSQSFDGRPNFIRYNMLFGDRNNSMAFADWSDLHKKRRDIISMHTFPRLSTSIFETLDNIATENIMELLDHIRDAAKTNNGVYALKPKLSPFLCKIFMKFFCSVDCGYEEPGFQRMVADIDRIFTEVNEACIGDLIPSLMPLLFKSHLAEIGHDVRDYVIKKCVEPRMALREQHEKAKLTGKLSTDENNNATAPVDVPNDLLNGLLNNLNGKEGLSLDTALSALEDLVGGHAAISNTFIRILHIVANQPKIQEKIREETRNSVSGFTKLGQKLPYTEATLWEACRHISSPIVPHCSSEDTYIDDYFVKKGTIIFFNNLDLHFSTTLWKDPEQVIPERFLTEDGSVLKPDHFNPFGTGKRSCLGFKLTMSLCCILISNLCLNFDIQLDPTEDYTMLIGNISVPGVGKRFIFKPIDC